MTIELGWYVFRVGAFVLVSALSLKLMASWTDNVSKRGISLLGGKDEVIRKSRRLFAVGLAIILFDSPFLIYRHFGPKMEWLTILLLSAWVIIGPFLLAMVWQLRPVRKDPFDIGDWAGHERDRSQHGKS